MSATIYIVRHGQTDWNVEDRIQGHSDPPLNALGRSQASDAAKKLQHVHFDQVFSSDLLRAKQTAEIIALEREMEVLTTKALRERTWGSMEGRLGAEYREELKEKIGEFEALSEEQQFSFKIAHDIESNEELYLRLSAFLREISVAYPDKTLLVTCHAGIMRSLLKKLVYPLRNGVIKHTAYIKLKSDGVDFFIEETYGIESEA